MRFIQGFFAALLALSAVPEAARAQTPRGAVPIIEAPSEDYAWYRVHPVTGALTRLEEVWSKPDRSGSSYFIYLPGASSPVAFPSNEPLMFLMRFNGLKRQLTPEEAGPRPSTFKLGWLSGGKKEGRYATEGFVPMEEVAYGPVTPVVDRKNKTTYSYTMLFTPKQVLPAGEYALSIFGLRSPAGFSAEKASAFRITQAPPAVPQTEARPAAPAAPAVAAGPGPSTPAPSVDGMAALVERLARGSLDAGRPEEALAVLMSALRTLPEATTLADEMRLHNAVLDSVARMASRPPVPAEASQRFARTAELQRLLGSGTTPEARAAVVAELRATLRLAPWWDEARLALAEALKSVGRVDDAIMTVTLTVPTAATVTRPSSPPPPTSPPPTSPPVATGRFVVLLPNVFAGKPRRFRIVCDGVHAADLGDQRYLELAAAAGRHNLSFGTEEPVSLLVDVTDGSVNYVEAGLSGWSGKLSLKLLPRESGPARIREKKIELNDPSWNFSPVCGVPGQGRP